MEQNSLKNIIEAAIFAAGEPVSVERLLSLFEEDAAPAKADVKELLQELANDWAEKGIELKEVNSGYRFQVRRDMSSWVTKLWEERAPRYSRALLETLALIAYRQPITRGEIEEIRGVSVSTHIMKTLQERDWVRIVGYRDVPGKPAMYASTREFLDYFNLKGLDDLPTLAEIRDIDKINEELELNVPGIEVSEAEVSDVAIANSELVDVDENAMPEEQNISEIEDNTEEQGDTTAPDDSDAQDSDDILEEVDAETSSPTTVSTND